MLSAPRSGDDRSVVFLVPGDLESRTGGYGYDRRIIAGLRDVGWRACIVGLDASYPFPTRAARRDTAAALAAIEEGAVVVADGLAFGAMPDEAERERERLRFVALVHHPLATETGLSPQQIQALFDSERRALSCARRVVVTSRQTVETLLPYGVRLEEVTVVEPGTDPKPLASGSGDECVRLLCVASVSPRKGFETLIDALAAIRKRNWMLTIVGSVERDPEAARKLRERIDALSLGGRVVLLGERGEGEVDACYQRADLFVLPTLHEGYGMAVAEALAHGLPVVSTPTGAIADLVGSDGGVLVEPGDAAGLASVLDRIVSDRAYRERLAEGARRRRERLPSWAASIRRFERVLLDVALAPGG